MVGLGLVLVSSSGFSLHADAKSKLEISFKANVQKIAKDIQRRCSYDVRTFCKQALSGNIDLMHCLATNSEKQTPQCEYALFDAKRAVDGLFAKVVSSAQICQRAITRNCKKMPAGGGQLIQCLVDRQKSISGNCSKFVSLAAQVVPRTQGGSLLENSISAAVLGTKNCKTLAFSVTDWSRTVTAQDAKNLLAASIIDFAKKNGLEKYSSTRARVLCAKNINIIIASTHTCTAKTKVCW